MSINRVSLIISFKISKTSNILLFDIASIIFIIFYFIINKRFIDIE